MKKIDPIGMRVKVEPFDSNPTYLPLSGTITRRVSALNNVEDWFVLTPDTPVDYQQKIAPGPYTFRRVVCPQILIRSRWQGHEIGDQEPTSVFILLPPDQALLTHEPIDPEDFIFDAWGMCSKEE
ncbi:MAG: hypothetical protein ACYSWO_27205 [Planctomycetota bacterium]|jgi:hypothetical protein